MVTHSYEPECEATARIPSSPLPGSVRHLWQEGPTGRRQWWLSIDARTTATHRLGLLEQVAALLKDAELAPPERVLDALRALRILAAGASQRARQPDVLLALCRRLGRHSDTALEAVEESHGVCNPVGDSDEHEQAPRDVRARLCEVRRVVEEEAALLSEAWRALEPQLSKRFAQLSAVASASGRSVGRSVDAAPTARGRRFALELEIPSESFKRPSMVAVALPLHGAESKRGRR